MVEYTTGSLVVGGLFPCAGSVTLGPIDVGSVTNLGVAEPVVTVVLVVLLTVGRSCLTAVVGFIVALELSSWAAVDRDNTE